MANWKHRIDIVREWQACQKGELSIQALAAKVVLELRKIHEPDDPDLEDLIYEFEGIRDDPAADQADFDSVLEHLYDWGDITLSDRIWPHVKMCWIATNF